MAQHLALILWQNCDIMYGNIRFFCLSAMCPNNWREMMIHTLL